MRFSKKRLTAYFFLLINTVVWGATFVVVKPAFEIISPFYFLFSRYLLAAVLCLPILVYYIRKIKITAKMLVTITLLEMIGTTLNLSLLYIGLTKTSAIETSLITTTAPLFVVLLSIIFLKEREERNEWLGILLSFLGMIVITLLPVLNTGFISKEASLIGNLLIVTAIITESSYFITAKKQYKKIPKLFVATISFIVGSVSFGLLSLWESSWSFTNLTTKLSQDFQHPPVIFAVVYMAVFGSIIGLTTYIKGQDSVEASEASIFRYLQPLVYLPLGVLVLGETVSFIQLVGLGLIVLGFLVAEVRSNRR